jgi:TolA-binding protein
LDCGLVWNYLRTAELKEFISKHCAGSDKEDAYALLSEGVRLESQGDTAGALAKYAAVMEKFPGTAAAKDAVVSIRNLTHKLG